MAKREVDARSFGSALFGDPVLKQLLEAARHDQEGPRVEPNFAHPTRIICAPDLKCSGLPE